MAVDNNPDACVVKLFNPLTDRENIVANIMELHKPTAIMVHTAVLPSLFIDTKINPTAITAQQLNTTEGFATLRRYDPINRPTSMLPQ